MYCNTATWNFITSEKSHARTGIGSPSKQQRVVLRRRNTVVGGKCALPSALLVIVSHRIIWSWYTGRWWVGCYIWYSDEGTGRGRSPPRPLIAVSHVTAHPSTASVPITLLLCNGLLLCGSNVPIKGLSREQGPDPSTSTNSTDNNRHRMKLLFNKVVCRL